jgi:hypothetical protein
LKRISLDSALRYTALSYMWGLPDFGRVILLNCQPLYVRNNLWNFLKEGRSCGAQEPILW